MNTPNEDYEQTKITGGKQKVIIDPTETAETDELDSKFDSEKKTVRGSGFTYTEEQKRTDKSIPLEEANEKDIVTLPDLGQKNRP